MIWGDSIYAAVTAINSYGNSLISDGGNGAIILTNPDPPQLLIEEYSKRAATSLGFSWSNGAENGGSPILDYQITFDQSTDTFVTLEAGVITKYY